MDILGLLQVFFAASLLSEAWNGKQKLFARVAIGSWFGIFLLAQFELDNNVLTYPLFFIGLVLGLWMYGIKLKYVISSVISSFNEKND